MIKNIKTTEKLGFLNLLVLILSIYVLITLLVSTFFTLSEELTKLLDYLDNLICGIFFIDFLVRLKKAPNKLKFMKWGWIDLISCIPMVDYFRTGRLLRLIRIFRIIRAFRTLHGLFGHVFHNKVRGTFSSAAMVAIMLVIFSSIAILEFENVPNGNIKTAEDAIWWSFVTITTVGYGDKYPVTTEGRLIAVVLITAGVGLFGVFSGFIASWFVGENKNNETKA